MNGIVDCTLFDFPDQSVLVAGMLSNLQPPINAVLSRFSFNAI